MGAREAALRAREATKGLTWDQYASDWLRQSAVERQLEIVGEALNRLRQGDPDTAVRIPDLRSIIGTRNVIAHGYDIVDHELIWSLVHDEIPTLCTVLETLLGEAPPPQ
ncbi:HepT-like ribonuclease domain-containing protein [Prauserella isguenensis]|uniref:HepT-like ribonuclease domain-containing protein n=1 Tax=Prauserella isguenensis TaxID=1470180 RepID=UPI0031B6437A